MSEVHPLQWVLVRRNVISPEGLKEIVRHMEDSQKNDLQVFDPKKSNETGDTHWRTDKEVRDTQIVDMGPLFPKIKGLLEDTVKNGFDRLAELPDWYTWLVFTVCSAAIGIRGGKQFFKHLPLGCSLAAAGTHFLCNCSGFTRCIESLCFQFCLEAFDLFVPLCDDFLHLLQCTIFLAFG